MEIFESYPSYYGVDTYPIMPTRSSRSVFSHRAVNRSSYKLINDTRPPFIEIQLKFQSTEEEYTFRNAAITGVKFYEGEVSLFSSFLIVTVGDRIFAGYIKPGFIEFFTIYKGIDPQWMHQFFCQALNIITFNNSNDFPLYWTGDIVKPAKFVYDSAYTQGSPMRISNVAAYAHGRMFTATKENLLYASNFILSQGLGIEKREAVLSYTESEYPSSGDGFGAPSEMGQITGVTSIPQSNTLNGHGDVIVTCRNGMFSIAPNRKLRNQWTEDPEMQKYVLMGKGCVSHNSIAQFANQIFYRDSNGGISSLMMDIANYQQQSELQSVSTPVDYYTDYDKNSPDIQFCHSLVTDRRMIMGVNYNREKSSHMGVHRFASGMVSACLQMINGKTTMQWEGLWTGPRITGSAVTNIGNSKRTIVSSYDSDKQNRLYYLGELERTDDFTNNAHRKIRSSVTYSGVFFDEAQDSQIVPKRIEQVEALLIQSNVATFTGSYQTDGMSEQYPIDFQLTEINGCGKGLVRAVSDEICGRSKSESKQTISKSGFFFAVTLRMEGSARIAKIVIAGSADDSSGFSSTKCSEIQSPGVTQLCFTGSCETGDFNYTF